ncbi:MAG: rhomboid-like protein [Mycobacterium sp.]
MGSESKLRPWLAAIWRFVSSAPLTYLWLAVLLITTIVQRHLSRQALHTELVHGSTNLYHLARDPLEVLFYSLLWIDGRYWTPYLVLFTMFLAPAERWLGKIRWLTVGLTAHIGATYISEGLLYLAIQLHLEPEKLVHARDIGVSYFLVGVIAVLSYHIVRPWRWGYLAILFIVFTVPLLLHVNFTAVGHFAAILIGLCFYPMARHRGRNALHPTQLMDAEQ